MVDSLEKIQFTETSEGQHYLSFLKKHYCTCSDAEILHLFLAHLWAVLTEMCGHWLLRSGTLEILKKREREVISANQKRKQLSSEVESTYTIVSNQFITILKRHIRKEEKEGEEKDNFEDKQRLWLEELETGSVARKASFQRVRSDPEFSEFLIHAEASDPENEAKIYAAFRSQLDYLDGEIAKLERAKAEVHSVHEKDLQAIKRKLCRTLTPKLFPFRFLEGLV